MEFLKYCNLVFAALFFLCCCTQIVYIPVALFFRKKKSPASPAPLHRFAVLICARNEEKVIGSLLRTVKEQDYPGTVIPFVLADNCTDGTASAAREAGAIVYTRTDPEKNGKGYALDALLSHLRADYPEGFDGYFVFDADNLLSPSFVTGIDRVFSAGHDIVTGLRCSKNPTDNWVSAGHTLHFLRGCRFLNEPRDILGVSAAVNGTGFFFSRRIAGTMGGWRYYLLTEDTQFSADMILRGEKIAYCPDAVFYDEQPVSFRQSWRQRLRWAKGFLQVFGKYGASLFTGALRGSFSCFDMLTAACPVFILSALSLLTNIGTVLVGLISGVGLLPSLLSFGKLLLSMYLTAFAVGALVLLAEWKHIAGKPIRKLFMPFCYPLFLFTFLPITVQAVFCRVEWKPIEHTGRKTEE